MKRMRHVHGIASTMLSLLIVLICSEVHSQTAHVIPVESPTVVELGQLGGEFVAEGQRASWSPQGDRIVFCLPLPTGGGKSPRGLRVFNVQTKEVAKLTDVGQSPAWSPGEGQWIAYEVVSGEKTSLWLIDSQGRHARELCEGTYPYWNKDGKTLYFYAPATKALMRMDTSDAAAQATKVMDIPTPNPAVSLDGTKVAYRTGPWLRVVNPTSGDQLGRFVLPGGDSFLGDFSPDGQYLAFGDNKAGIRGLWLLNLATGDVARLTNGTVGRPSWSRDGARLACTVTERDKQEIWTIDRAVFESASGPHCCGTVCSASRRRFGQVGSVYANAE